MDVRGLSRTVIGIFWLLTLRMLRERQDERNIEVPKSCHTPPLNEVEGTAPWSQLLLRACPN